MAKLQFDPKHYPYAVVIVGDNPHVMYTPELRTLEANRTGGLTISGAYKISQWMNARRIEGMPAVDIESNYQELLDAIALGYW